MRAYSNISKRSNAEIHKIHEQRRQHLNWQKLRIELDDFIHLIREELLANAISGHAIRRRKINSFVHSIFFIWPLPLLLFITHNCFYKPECQFQ